jgi:transcriptional regulator with XRE-family HTH domain
MLLFQRICGAEIKRAGWGSPLGVPATVADLTGHIVRSRVDLRSLVSMPESKPRVASPVGIFERRFADNLRRLIGAHRTNQGAVAKASGVTRQTIAELVTGVRAEPSLKTLYAVADLFSVDPDKLLRQPFFEWAGDYFSALGGADVDARGLTPAAAAIADRLATAEADLADITKRKAART